MSEFIEKLDMCINSPNLGKRHQCLIDLVAGLLSILNSEIGEIGDGAIREIIDVQKRLGEEISPEILPLSSAADDHDTCLNIVLGAVNANDIKYDIGVYIAIPWNGDWDFLGWSGTESMACDIRALSRSDVTTAAKRLAVAVIVLDEVFREPSNTLANMAEELKRSDLLQLIQPAEAAYV